GSALIGPGPISSRCGGLIWLGTVLRLGITTFRDWLLWIICFRYPCYGTPVSGVLRPRLRFARGQSGLYVHQGHADVQSVHVENKCHRRSGAPTRTDCCSEQRSSVPGTPWESRGGACEPRTVLAHAGRVGGRGGRR